MNIRERSLMILTINTIERDQIELGLFDGHNLYCFEFETANQSDDILHTIEGILSKQKLKLQNLTAILVHHGPGSYTGVRVGATVANTIAWTLNIPVLAYGEDNLIKCLEKVQKQSNFQKLALPKYYAKII